MPLLAWVFNEAVAFLPISQPFTQEMFPDLNPWAPVPASGWRKLQTWNSRRGKWEPLPESGVLPIPLPLTEVPLVRFSGATWIKLHPSEACKGGMVGAMPSIKAQIYDVPFIWPQRLPLNRYRLNASWCVTFAGRVPAIESRWVDVPGPGETVREDGSENDVALGLHGLY